MKNQFVIYFLFIQLFVIAQNVSELNEPNSPSSLEFKWSNDFEFNTDYYYTNGFSFELFTPWAKTNPVNSILLPHTSNETALFGLTLLQDIFTPKSRFDIHKQLNGDRPFAAYVLLGAKKISFDKTNNLNLYSELQIGVLGPAALGKETQDGIHRNIPTSQPLNGWENQISNSLMINYSASVEKQIYNNSWIEFTGISSAKLGLPFTNAEVGFKTRIGFFDSFPTDFKFISKQKWQLFLTLSAKGCLIGYNATLQGGLFSESVYTLNNINRFVGYASFGITGIYKQFKMEYSQNFNTPEFPNAVYHSWGYLSIKFGF